jgi:hypothetical protein
MNENWLGAFAPSQPHIERPRERCEPCGISYCICLARYLPDDYSIARVVEKVLVSRFEIVREAKDLKTIVSTDDPNL